jgi:hypothetical protein
MAQKIPFLFLTSVFSAPLRLDKLLVTAPDTESAEKKQSYFTNHLERASPR